MPCAAVAEVPAKVGDAPVPIDRGRTIEGDVLIGTDQPVGTGLGAWRPFDAQRQDRLLARAREARTVVDRQRQLEQAGGGVAVGDVGTVRLAAVAEAPGIGGDGPAGVARAAAAERQGLPGQAAGGAVMLACGGWSTVTIATSLPWALGRSELSVTVSLTG